MTNLARKLRREMTWPAVALWQAIKNGQITGFKFRKQAVIGRFIADFYCPKAKLVIEIDGDSHTDLARDQARTEILEELGLRVVRYTNDEVIHELDYVLDSLWQHLIGREANPSPPPPLQGGDKKE